MAQGLEILPQKEAARLYYPFRWVPAELHGQFYDAAGQFISEASEETFPLGKIAVLVEMDDGNKVYHPFTTGVLIDPPTTPLQVVR